MKILSKRDDIRLKQIYDDVVSEKEYNDKYQESYSKWIKGDKLDDYQVIDLWCEPIRWMCRCLEFWSKMKGVVSHTCYLDSVKSNVNEIQNCLDKIKEIYKL